MMIFNPCVKKKSSFEITGSGSNYGQAQASHGLFYKQYSLLKVTRTLVPEELGFLSMHNLPLNSLLTMPLTINKPKLSMVFRSKSAGNPTPLSLTSRIMSSSFLENMTWIFPVRFPGNACLIQLFSNSLYNSANDVALLYDIKTSSTVLASSTLEKL